MSNKHIGIMYTSTWPEDMPDAHCTLLYLGTVDDADFTKEDVQDAVDSVEFAPLGDINTMDTEYFGPDKDIPVVRLDRNYNLVRNRYHVLLELMKRGITTKSEYVHFKPHITVNSFDGLDIPDTVFLEDKPVVWWDE